VKQKTYVSMVVYVRNEEETVADMLERLSDYLRDAFELYEIVLVDDASADQTLERARQVALRNQHPMTVVELARRHGVEAGMQAGLERVVGDWIFELESSSIDFELDLLTQMYEQAARGFEIVTAAGDRGSRRSQFFYGVVNRYADLEEPLRTVRLRLTSRRSLNTMLSMKEKVRYRKALYAFVGARQHHIVYPPLPTTDTRRVAHRLDRETTRLAFDVLLSFSGFGLRLAHRLSFTFGLVSLLAIAYAVFVYLFKENVVQGWTTATVFVSGGFAGIFLVLGIIGEYLARILIEVRGRPLYSVRAADVVVPTGSSQDKPAANFMLEQRDEALRSGRGSSPVADAPASTRSP
jgi:glycosyltransferase involved in cell wall biosynthesis